MRIMAGRGSGWSLDPLEDLIADIEITIEGDDNTEDVEPLKMAKDPKLPSAEEVAAHRQMGHIPYRSWCKFCLMGRGRGCQHRHAPGSMIPRIGVDYFFIVEGGVKHRKELDFELTPEGDAALEAARRKGDVVKAVLVRCMGTKCLFAHVVPCKGADEEDYVANMVAEDILWLGHVELILKGDNERSLQALI